MLSGRDLYVCYYGYGGAVVCAERLSRAASPTGDFKALRVQYNRLKNCTATTQVCNCGAELEDLNAAQGWCGTSLRTPLVPLIEDTCSVTSGCMSWHVPVCVVAWLWLCGKTVLATHTRPLRGLT